MLLCCGIASPNPGTDKRLGPNHHTKEGGWLWLNHHPCFSTSKMPKKIDRYLFYFILPKIPAEIFCQNILQDISPKSHERYFAKISRKIFCQNIPKDILPEYPTRYLARISHQIFCQNIPQDILPEYPAKYFARISRQIFWQKFANISHKISCQNSHKDP